VSLPPLTFAAPMCSAQDDAALPAPGFPIRKSTGQRLFSASPWLIAAVHVLLRLLVPRHPPHALSILTVINRSRTAEPFQSETTRCFGHLCSFQGPARKHVTRQSRARSLKTKQHAGQAVRPKPLPDRSTFRDAPVPSSRPGRARTLACRPRRTADGGFRAP
jgi:hypothetical protein